MRVLRRSPVPCRSTADPASRPAALGPQKTADQPQISSSGFLYRSFLIPSGGAWGTPSTLKVHVKFEYSSSIPNPPKVSESRPGATAIGIRLPMSFDRDEIKNDSKSAKDQRPEADGNEEQGVG